MDLQFQTNAPNGDFTDHGLKTLNGFLQKADKKAAKQLIAKYYEKGIQKKPFQYFRNILRMATFDHTPKIHAILKDSKKEWKEGVEINFVYENEGKVYEFAPPTPVTLVQNIKIKSTLERITIIVDENVLTDEQAFELARNEGFLTLAKLADFFFHESKKKEFTGVIVHWTKDVAYYGTGDKE